MSKKRILVVDDEDKILDILKHILEAKKYSVKVAKNGKEALNKFNSFKPHLIIADIMMPDMDGFELCKRIRQDSIHFNVRFIFLTAKTDKKDEALGLKLGADDYITKPFDIETLLLRVENRLKWINIGHENITNNGLFTGNIVENILIEILSMLELGEKEGTLYIINDFDNGIITFKNGDIVEAKTEKKLYGEKAIFLMLSYKDGLFRFLPKTISDSEYKKKNCFSVSKLILEWATLWDEFKRGASKKNITSEDFYNYLVKTKL